MLSQFFDNQLKVAHQHIFKQKLPMNIILGDANVEVGRSLLKVLQWKPANRSKERHTNICMCISS